MKRKSAFTLLEVLLVIAIFAIFSGIVILAINPSQRLAESNNAQRRADVKEILNAIYQYSLDSGGKLPASITNKATEICATDVSGCSGLIDLSVLTAGQLYMVSMPIDPNSKTINGTGYFVSKSDSDRITVSAPNAESGVMIDAQDNF